MKNKQGPPPRAGVTTTVQPELEASRVGWADTDDYEVLVSDPGRRYVRPDTEKHLGERRAFLTLVVGDTPGKRFPLGRITTIGRSEKSTIQFDASMVSRSHAQIQHLPDGSYEIEDLSSNNGTWLNGQQVRTAQLEAGDRIEIGARYVLRFSWSSEAEETWLEARKMESLGRLAGGIAHDFNNLLLTIMGNVDFLKMLVDDHSIDDPTMNDCFADLKQASRQSADLVKQLLGFARRSSWEKHPTDLSRLIDELSNMLRRTFDPRINLITKVEPGLSVLGDSTQLHQMLLNLCINARDSITADGEVTVSAHVETAAERAKTRTTETQRGKSRSGETQKIESPSAWIRLEVRDTGSGMPTDVAPYIFEPFFTTKQGGRGTGLGLAVVYGIVTGHGGRIAVDSEPDRGTNVIIRLPLSKKTAGRIRQVTAGLGKRPTDLAEDEPVTLLVVDDEVMVQQSLRRSLERLGYEVVTASDGREALEIFERLRASIDLVLLDLIMPKMDGVEALRGIKAINPLARVIVMSGYHEEVDLETLRSSGAATFLPKPFSNDDLAVALKAALGSSGS